MAVRARRRVRAVPDLWQRALALRAAPRSHRPRLPSRVRRPDAGSKDAAVMSGSARESGAGLSRRRTGVSAPLCGRAGLATIELGLQLLDLGVRVCLALLDATLVQLPARLALGLPLGLLRRGDLALDVDGRP